MNTTGSRNMPSNGSHIVTTRYRLLVLFRPTGYDSSRPDVSLYEGHQRYWFPFAIMLDSLDEDAHIQDVSNSSNLARSFDGNVPLCISAIDIELPPRLWIT